MIIIKKSKIFQTNKMPNFYLGCKNHNEFYEKYINKILREYSNNHTLGIEYEGNRYYKHINLNLFQQELLIHLKNNEFPDELWICLIDDFGEEYKRFKIEVKYLNKKEKFNENNEIYDFIEENVQILI